jgi:hypothetical protein
VAKVCVSSTRLDLEPERQAVFAWLTQADHQPVHSYVADSQTVRRGCLADVRACEAYVLILGYRYGFVPPDDNPEGLSITELEYRAAIEAGLPVVALRAKGARDVELTDIGTPVYSKVDGFVRLVGRKHRVFLFSDEADLVAGLSSGLQKALRDGSRPDPGTLGQIGKLYLDDAKKAQMLLTQSLAILMPHHLEAVKRILAAGESPGAGDRERAAAQALRADDPWPAESLLKEQQVEDLDRARASPDPASAASERIRAAQCARDRGALVMSKDRNATLAAYLDATTCSPEDRSVWTSLGHLYVALRRLDDAESAFARAADAESPAAATPMPKLFTAFR